MTTDPEQSYLQAIAGPQKSSAPPTPEETYIARVRQGQDQPAARPAESAEEQPSGPARDDRGRFTKEPEEQAQEPTEAPPRLTPWQTADRFVGRQPDEEELHEREQVRAQEELRDGTAVQRIANEQRVWGEMVADLKETCPGIDSEAFIQQATPIVEAIAAEYGDEAASDVTVLRQLYRELGGAEKFGPDEEAEEWNRALYQPTGSVFTR